MSILVNLVGVALIALIVLCERFWLKSREETV
jgi:hypothetical protein